MSRTTFYVRMNVQVAMQPNIGLDASARQSVVEILNVLLADEAVLLLKTGRADGFAGGVDVPDLHPLYEAHNKQIMAISNELAERIQILGGSPLSGSDQLLDSARLDGRLSAVPGVLGILADHEAFVRFLREDARRCSEVFEDQGSFALLVSILRTHEKMVWILRSNIPQEQFAQEN